MDVIGQNVQVEKLDAVSLAGIQDGASNGDLILRIQDERRPDRDTEFHHTLGDS